jgi:uncharacterized repeat protein (TIGR01451 family)
MLGRVIAGWALLSLATGEMSRAAVPVVYIGGGAPAACPHLRAKDLAANDQQVRLPDLRGASALDPKLVLALLGRSGKVTLEVPGDVILGGDWDLPAGSLEIHSQGALTVDGAFLHGRGTHLTLRGNSVRLLAAARVDLADPAGRGGSVALLGSDSQSDGLVEVSPASRIDVGGAPHQGGDIHLAGTRVTARGGLYALGGGRIEIDARAGLDFSSPADTGGGVIRLDPPNLVIDNFSGTNTNVTIVGGDVTPSAATGQLDAGNLVTLLGSNDVVVHTNNSFSAGAGLMPTLPAPYVADNTEGDIAVLAPVVWNSTHSLTLLAQDDLFLLASVQNGGTGEVVGLAGWDGSSFGSLDAPDPTLGSPTYGNGTGDAYVAAVSAGATAFGSRDGLTTLRGRNVLVLGSTAAASSNDSAMVGYRVTVNTGNPFDAQGPIAVFAKGSVTVAAGVNNGLVRFAQIGHGGGLHASIPGQTSQGNLTGDITVVAGTTLDLHDGVDFSYAQIGHGGLANARFRGNIGPALPGDPTADIAVQAASVSLTADHDSGGGAGYAQIGHGGTTWTTGVQGNLAGKITVGTIASPVGSLTLRSDHNDVADNGSTMGAAQIGHGGVMNTGTSIGNQSGDIEVHVSGDASLLTNTVSARTGNAQIGHGGEIYFGAMGNATGNVTVLVGGKLDVTGGASSDFNFSTAQIGHGGAMISAFIFSAIRGVLQGNLDVEAGGPLTLTAGSCQIGFSQIGSGGAILSLLGGNAVQGDPLGAGASGSLTVKAPQITLTGGSGQAAYAQVGHGGFFAGCNPNVCAQPDSTGGTAAAGAQSGSLDVESTTGKLDLVGGSDANGQAYAMIGNGGFDGSGAGTNGKQGNASGSVSALVHGETSLIDDPASSQWWIGHRTSGTIVSPSPVKLDTGTLDFSAAAATNATINNAQFWPRFALNNVVAGGVTLRVHGLAPAGDDGALIVQQPLTVPAATTNEIDAISTKDVTLSAAITNGGTGFVDLVDDDANPISPAMGASALFTLGVGGSVSGPVRLYAVSPSQFAGTPPTPLAFSVWHDQSGTPVVGTNFKSANPMADLAVTKAGSPDPVTAGTNLTYTITVTNNGPGPASSASWSDALPAGTTFVSLPAVAGWSCTTPTVGMGGTVSCSNPSFAVGSSVFTLTVAVASSVPAGTVLTNTATATSTTPDPNPGNNSGMATTTVAASADLSTQKGDAPDPVTAGNNLTYTITVTNAGPSAAAAAALADTLPAGTTFVSLASPGGWSCTSPAVGASGTVSCSNPSLGVGNAVFTLVVKVGAAVAAGTVLTNTATASSSTPDPKPGNESGTATTTVAAAADLSVTKTGAPDPVTPGGQLVYTITVTNGGPSNAASVSLNDTLPAGTTFVSLPTPAGWSCGTPAVGAGGTVSCTIASLGPGSTVFTLTVKVGSSVTPGTVITNTAAASSSTTDPNPGNESGTATTTVGAASADLAATKTGSPNPVAPGANLVYTITVNNPGPSNATLVSLSDPLPAGTTFVSLSSPGGWSCSTPAVGANGTVSCSLASFAPGSAVFTLTVTIASTVPSGTMLTNTAAVSSPTDSNPANNAGSVSTTVESSPPVAQIPTLSDAGLFVLAALLGLAGVGLFLRRGAA